MIKNNQLHMYTIYIHNKENKKCLEKIAYLFMIQQC